MVRLYDHTQDAPYLIAEVGLAHGGSYTLASSYIKLCKDLGLNAVKFQHHCSFYESTPSESFRASSPHISSSSRSQYWDDTSFTIHQWTSLCKYAKSLNIDIGITPNSRYSLLDINQCGFDFIKIGSSDFSNYHLLDELSSYTIPIIASLGFASTESIDYLLTHYSFEDLYLLDCISSYPSKLSNYSVNRLVYLKSVLPDCFQIGLSDHSGSIMPILASFLAGFKVFEFHITISPHVFNFDLEASLSIEQVSTLQLCIKDYLGFSKADPPDSFANLSDVHVLKSFQKFLFVSNQELSIGHHITPDDILVMRASPSDCQISQDQYHKVIGKKLARTLSPLSPLTSQDLLLP